MKWLWKREIIERLRLLPYQRCALECLPLELRRLEEKTAVMRSRLQGLSRVPEDLADRLADRLTDRLADDTLRYGNLLVCLEKTKASVAAMEAALAVLPEADRQLLGRLYLKEPGGMRFESGTTFYRYRDEALLHFAQALRGN